MEDLDYLRKQIDEIDDSMVKLFLKRMELVHNVADYKIKNNMEVLAESREEQIISRHTERIQDKAAKSYVKEFLEELMHISRESQKEIMDSKNF